MNTTTDQLRSKIASQPTPTLLDALDDLEPKARTNQPERIAYAVTAATVARRLGVKPSDAAYSAMGAASYLRTVHDLAA